MTYGLWHNGWCSFRTARNADHTGYGYSGTQEEAIAGKAEFVAEGQLASEYEVAYFDHEREPFVKAGKPSPVQLEALKHIEKTGYTNTTRVTYRVMLDRGWICSSITADGRQAKSVLRLTRAGRALLKT